MTSKIKPRINNRLSCIRHVLPGFTSADEPCLIVRDTEESPEFGPFQALCFSQMPHLSNLNFCQFTVWAIFSTLQFFWMQARAVLIAASHSFWMQSCRMVFASPKTFRMNARSVIIASCKQVWACATPVLISGVNFPLLASALLTSVFSICQRIAKKQVLRIAARRVIAIVQNNQFWIVISVREQVHQARSAMWQFLCSNDNCQLPVSSARRCRPWPAFIFAPYIYLRPQPFDVRFSEFWMRSNNTLCHANYFTGENY